MSDDRTTSGAALVQAALEQTGISIATSADTARAIALRGMCAVVGVVRIKLVAEQPSDDFGDPWERLPADVQSQWLTLASYLDKLARTPGWSGQLGGAT